MANKVNFYIDQNTGEVLSICEQCFNANPNQMKDLEYVDKAGDFDDCYICEFQNIPSWYHEKPEFPHGEFDNGNHWKGEYA